MKKRNMLLLTILALATSLLAVNFVSAADEFTIVTTRSETRLEKYNGNGGAVVIPPGVTSIGKEAFLGCSTLTAITIPESVKSIGDSAFKGCASLTSLVIPDSVTSIGNGAFYECFALKDLVIGQNVTKMGSSVFMYCSSLERVVIPDKVTKIEGNSFYKCAELREVVLGSSVTAIENRAFADCPLLKTITLGSSVQSIKASAFSTTSGSYLKRTIYAPSGSYAEQFAAEQHLKFVAQGSKTAAVRSFAKPKTNLSLPYNPSFTVTEAIDYVFDHDPDTYYFYSGVPYLQTVVSEAGGISVLYLNPDEQDRIFAYEYSPSMEFIGSVSFSKELEQVGAFAKDSEGNYYIFYAKKLNEAERGQENMLLVKYSATGQKIGSCAAASDWDGSPAGVAVPFSSGNCRLEISGNLIAVYFARTMFNGHQSSLGLIYNRQTMEMIPTVGSGRPMSVRTASHSFNQFLLPVDGGFMVVNHGDAHPRAFEISDIEDNIVGNNRINALEFYNPDPDLRQPQLYNQTYAEMGALAQTDQGYIFAGTYDRNKPQDGVRNLFVLTMDQELNTVSEPIWLTAYTSYDAIRPKLVRIAQDNYLLLWRADKTTYMSIINGRGEVQIPARVIPDTVLNASDVLRYSPVTGLVHWAVPYEDNSFALYGFDPYQEIKAQTPVRVSTSTVPTESEPQARENTAPEAPQPAKPEPQVNEAIVMTIASSRVTRGNTVLAAPPVPPQLINSRTMLPFRYLVQTVLGGEVSYDAATQVITAKVQGHEVVMAVGELQIRIDGNTYEYGQAPLVVDGSTLVPLRAFEQVITEIKWDAQTNTLTIIP